LGWNYFLLDNAGRGLKNALSPSFRQLLTIDRVLVFDQAAARHYWPIMAARRRAGSPMAAPDGQIAAIARSQAMDLATRTTRDFRSCGLALIDPWG
jgi:predicted nucleic acid-binding protein